VLVPGRKPDSRGSSEARVYSAYALPACPCPDDTGMLYFAGRLLYGIEHERPIDVILPHLDCCWAGVIIGRGGAGNG